MPVKKVWLHKTFYWGRNDNEIFRDFSKLNDAEFDLLVDFVDEITAGKPLKGRNKPSWLNKNGVKIKGTDAYEECNVWHYHAGPHPSNAIVVTPNIRETNLGDNTSDSVIHYTWHGQQQDAVVILGFSPQHALFPMPKDTSNVLRSRMRKKGIYPNDQLFDLDGTENAPNDDLETEQEAS